MSTGEKLEEKTNEPLVFIPQKHEPRRSKIILTPQNLPIKNRLQQKRNITRDYVFDKIIGKGAYGEVFKAVNIHNKKLRAIK
jgi:serine/threonine protein kinase